MSLVWGIYQLLVNSPHKGTALVFSLLTWTSCWTDSWIAGDLEHHGTHVTSLHCVFGIFSADVVSPWFSSSHGFSVRPLHCIDFLETKSRYDLWRYQQASLGRNTDLHIFKIILYEKQGLNWPKINGLVQERRNSSVLAMELHLSCTNPS